MDAENLKLAKSVCTFVSNTLKCSIYLLDDLLFCDGHTWRRKNFLKFLETDLTQLSSNNSNFKKPRIFVSTKNNILDNVEKGLFREDLYYRLNVVSIKMPSLKDKFEDIPDLVSHFLKKNYQTKSINRSVSHEGLNLLKEYYWSFFLDLIYLIKLLILADN